MGIELRLETEVGIDIPFSKIREDYDYVFLCTGAHLSLKLGIGDEDESPYLISGLGLLKRVALGEKVDLGAKVVIIGGGNTAVDAARTALRLGAEVSVIYRRSEKEMPAHAEEVREAREEGVDFRFLAAPEKIEAGKDGAVKKLICSEMELGEPDKSGRRRPIKKEGSFFAVEADAVVSAIGEVPLLDHLKGEVNIEDRLVVVDEVLAVDSMGEGGAKIFAGGDIIDIPRTVVHAVAAGKRAAMRGQWSAVSGE